MQFICVYETLLRKFEYKFLICQLKHFKNSKNNKTMSKILSLIFSVLNKKQIFSVFLFGDTEKICIFAIK